MGTKKKDKQLERDAYIASKLGIVCRNFSDDPKGFVELQFSFMKKTGEDLSMYYNSHKDQFGVVAVSKSMAQLYNTLNHAKEGEFMDCVADHIYTRLCARYGEPE